MGWRLEAWLWGSSRDSAQVAARLCFLRRARQVTLQALAAVHGTQRSNLSSFITSGGQKRSVSCEKLDRVLFELGGVPDGALRPGLHRWRLDADLVDGAVRELAGSGFERGLVLRLSSGFGGFLVAAAAGQLVQVFATLEPGCEEPLMGALGLLGGGLRAVDLDRAGDSAVQSLWLTQDIVGVRSALSDMVV